MIAWILSSTSFQFLDITRKLGWHSGGPIGVLLNRIIGKLSKVREVKTSHVREIGCARRISIRIGVIRSHVGG